MTGAVEWRCCERGKWRSGSDCELVSEKTVGDMCEVGDK